MFNLIAYPKYRIVFTGKIETVDALFKSTALKAAMSKREIDFSIIINFQQILREYF